MFHNQDPLRVALLLFGWSLVTDICPLEGPASGVLSKLICVGADFLRTSQH